MKIQLTFDMTNLVFKMKNWFLFQVCSAEKQSKKIRSELNFAVWYNKLYLFSLCKIEASRSPLSG